MKGKREREREREWEREREREREGREEERASEEGEGRKGRARMCGGPLECLRCAVRFQVSVSSDSKFLGSTRCALFGAFGHGTAALPAVWPTRTRPTRR